MQHVVILFYKYIEIEEPEALMESQKFLCKKLDLKGRMIIAKEGVNGTFEGTPESVREYCKALKSDPRFADVHIKKSEGNGKTFPKLSIKVRDEIVGSHFERDVNPTKVTGKYITAEELHELIHSDREFYIVDMRNDFEQEVGYFENSILPGMRNFRDLPKVLPKLAHLKGKTVITICTGGVRCEKASGFLVKNGFEDVYQLFGGIHSYMEKYPNEDFKGSLYVFDQRIVMGFNREEREVVGKCASCKTPSENYINCSNDICHKHFIMCEKCVASGVPTCPEGCTDSRFGAPLL
ncbi:MAG: rhodanese-related sulfurtransferase [bacterium]|nr:rhodanese-related sulfurtransferase [bacterium]